MPNGATTPLLPVTINPNSPSFFQKIMRKHVQIAKAVGLGLISGISSVIYLGPSASAGAAVHKALKYPAAIGGVVTNFTFNLESYYSLLRQFPQLLKMPFRLSLAIFFSIACVAPNLFMNIVDEDGNYVDERNMLLQGISAFFNISVNIVGSIELINSIYALKNNADIQKEKLLEEINLAIERFATSYPNETVNDQSQDKFIALFQNQELSLQHKIGLYSITTGIGILSIPQFLAYLLVSYFGMKDLSERKFGASSSISILLGSIAAIGNGIPGAGFSIKGVNSISNKLMSLEKPSLLAAFFVLPALFSGFTTHKAMADSLKELNYSGSTVGLLNWLSNLGAALIYNLPQMLALANRLGKKDTSAANEQLKSLQQHLEDQVRHLRSTDDIKEFKTNLPNTLSNFFTIPNVLIVNDDSFSNSHSDSDAPNTFRLSIN